jgi:D-alanine-D-alanine ligase
LLDELTLPLFVKPANGGSSVGISRVDSAERLGPAIGEALEHDGKVVVEQGIDAREIECAVLGNDEPEASGLGEVVPSREFYDYAAKYLDGTSELIIPADLDAETADRIRRASIAAFRALDLAGFARVDFLLDRGTGRHYLNEVNTLPGFTPISMFPKLWENAGMAYPRLIERLVELAVERSRAARGRRTRRGPG